MISMTARLLPLPKPSASTLMLPGVTWNQYEQLLQVFADRQFHLTYDQGRMEIRMPTPEHERPATLLDKILTILTLAFDLDIYSLGSTTFTSEVVEKGLEPDQCYYFKNVKKIAGKKRIDLRTMPAPDLAIEIDITSSSIPRLPIYASFGVPEVWRYDGTALIFYHLHRKSYRPAKASSYFPTLQPSDLVAWLQLGEKSADGAVLKQVQQWCQEQLKKE
jgi:Uma2 family endonuclease